MEIKQDRLKSKYLWVAVISLVAMVLGNYGLYDAIGMTSDVFQNVANAVLNIAVLVGIVNDPTDKVNW